MSRWHDPRSKPRPLAFPSILSDEQVDVSHAKAAQHEQRADPNHRKVKPDQRRTKTDPWPVLESAIPRIAAKIRKHWGTRALDRYLAKLVTSESARRRGFPLEVLVAALEIARLHNDQHRFKRPICPWEEAVRDSKWWERR